MLTLGIHDGHTATACLVENGRVIACLSEERLNREKEWTGFPERSIVRCLEVAGRSVEEIEAVGVCSLLPQTGAEAYHRPNPYKRSFSYLTRFFPKRFLQSDRNIRIIHRVGALAFRSRKRDIRRKLEEMGFRKSPVFFFEHHLCHAATAYYSNWHRPDEALVLTLDGSGDVVCASVNIGRAGRLERLAEIFNFNSVCDFYTRVTQYLGMKPMSHEYKLMGLAPYAAESRRRQVLEIFRRYFKASPRDPFVFINDSRLYKWQFMEELRDVLFGQRFDWVAGAAQDLFEEVALEWVRRSIRATGIGDLALSGGGFMNVKLNYLISRLPEVRSLFIFPSCGDESNPVGAAFLAALSMGFPSGRIQPLAMIDWGPSYGRRDVDRAIRKYLNGSGFKISRPADIHRAVVRGLLQGKIVGRFAGRMEWGARALGHRSILADPRNPKIIHKINQAIKMRDFWMPFAPAILDTFRKKYLVLRDDFRCPFMTIATPTRPRAWEDLAAALHPFDKSSRAQVLEPGLHPSFYDLVRRFSRAAGIGGVLNTSFNLHGDPIVCSPDDALDTFLKSELDAVQLEDVFIEKC